MYDVATHIEHKMIPLVDVKAQYSTIKKDIDRAIQDVIESGHFIHNIHLRDFEKEFASYLGVRFCVGMNSGSDALTLGIKALGLKPGDEIILPANAFMAAAEAISANNLQPVFVDVDEEDFGIDLTDLEKKVTKKTRGVIVVHLFGQPDKIEEIQDIIQSADQDIHLIEDACQAHGAMYRNKKIGTFGSFAAFSFNPVTNMGAFGDAGALVTNSSRIYGMVKLFHQHGQEAKNKHIVTGMNSRLDEMQAAIVRAKLTYLDEWNTTRQEIASLYTELLHKELPFLITPQECKHRASVYNHYVIRVPDRSSLMTYLSKQEIQTGIHYPIPLHLQRAFIYLGYKEGDMPVAEKLAEEILSLPIYPELTREDCTKVVSAIVDFYEKH